MKTIDALRQVYHNIVPQVSTDVRKVMDTEFKKMADLLNFQQEVLDCQSCQLQSSCTNKVPGEGPLDADIMFVGESPGEVEDKEGRPFVGPSGQLLNKILENMGWDRKKIYVTNVLKCHPPENRTPTRDEVTHCYQHLKREIEVIQPKVIVCWGSLAANTLIHPDFHITQEIGHWFEQGNTRLIAVYHPSYILRQREGSPKQNEIKWQVWRALQKVDEYQKAGFPSHESV